MTYLPTSELQAYCPTRGSGRQRQSFQSHLERNSRFGRGNPVIAPQRDLLGRDAGLAAGRPMLPGGLAIGLVGLGGLEMGGLGRSGFPGGGFTIIVSPPHPQQG